MKSQGDKFNLILQSLAKSGRQWDEVVPLALLADSSFEALNMTSPLFGDMLWQGNIEPQGEQFVLTGSWKMRAPRQCARCNIEFAAEMHGDVDITYVLGKRKNDEEQAELELAGDEPEILEAPGVLNVLDVLREHFWLAWQPMVVCSKGCKGLCLQCGIDLNTGGCDCHGSVKENPFAALKGFKFDA